MIVALLRRAPLTIALLGLALPAAALADGDNATFRRTSADGTRVIFETPEKMVPGDSDSFTDIYMRQGSATTLLTPGTTGSMTFAGASSDGLRVLFTTGQSLVPGDTDNNFADVYMREGSTTSLISAGAINGNGAFTATFQGASDDASRVFFSTAEKLVATDTDSSTDVYMRQGSTTTLISAGAINGNGAFPASFRGASSDGATVLFETAEKLVSADTDNSTDVYQRTGSTTTLISAGAINGNGAVPASFRGASSDGTKVFFETAEKLVSGDTDSSTDVYQRSVSTTSQISAGAVNGNGAFAASFKGVSSDGTKVFFETAESLVSTDTDTATDVYQRSGSVTSAVSTGNGAFNARFRGVATNGSLVVFDTSEPLLSTDQDTRVDIYRRLGTATPEIVSLGLGGAGNGDLPVTYRGNSPDASSVYFETQEPLTTDDEDESTDLFRFASLNPLFHVSVSNSGFDGGQAAFPARFAGAAAIGSNVFFTTFERLTPQDVDGARDIYVNNGSSTQLISIEANPPTVGIEYGPANNSLINDDTPTYGFSANEPVTFFCTVDGGFNTPCTSPRVFGPLTDGSHTVAISATDAAGNVSASPATRTFTVDTTPPDPSIDSGPTGVTNVATPTFTFSADEPVTFACRVDADPFAACSGPGNSHTTATLADGPHVFKLRARDTAGNVFYVNQSFTVQTGP